MRYLSQLPAIVNKEVSVAHPRGAIINETDTIEGTPVIRELYNDIISNLYKILDITGVGANGTEDSETTQYQLVEALQKLTNVHNDIEQVITLSGTVWSVPFDLSILPNRYVFFARPTDDYVAGTFVGNGTGGESYPFSSSGFNASDELLVIIDTSGVRAYKLNSSGSASEEVFTIMGVPLSYNDTDTLYYREDGSILTDQPKADYLESIIRVDEGDADIILTDMFVMQGYVLCCCFIPGDITYKFFQFALNDLTVSSPVNILSGTVPAGTDYNPYFYADGDYLYMSNDFNNSASNNVITSLTYDGPAGTLNFNSTITLDVAFVKTTNSAMKDKKIYTFVNGELAYYDINTTLKTTLGQFNGSNGNLFTYQGQIYFTAGEVAKIWA